MDCAVGSYWSFISRVLTSWNGEETSALQGTGLGVLAKDLAFSM